MQVKFKDGQYIPLETAEVLKSSLPGSVYIDTITNESYVLCPVNGWVKMGLEKEYIMKRLYIEIDEDTHQQIKSMALERRLSMKQYVMHAVLKRISEEKKYE